MIEIGVDVGGTTTRAVAFDALLGVVAARSTPSGRGADDVVDTIAALVDGVVAETGGTPVQVAIGVPGRVDPVAGVVATAVNLGLVGPVPLAALVAERVDSPVHVENDVNAAALGVFSHLGLTAPSSLAYINVGTGIAAGFVLEGDLRRGWHGGAGEIGHLPRLLDGPPCACGQAGCAEAMASGRAVSGDHRRAADVIPTVAWAVQLCVMTLDVELVAVGGGMTERAGFAAELATHLRHVEQTAPMLAGFGLTDRYVAVPADVPHGAVGAVLAARGHQVFS